jgi:hypothetical protein
MAESLFSTLECEPIARKTFETRSQARTAFQYVCPPFRGQAHAPTIVELALRDTILKDWVALEVRQVSGKASRCAFNGGSAGYSV